MATYLVTGVAGFIAAKVAEQLLAAGHRVVGVDNLNDYYDVRLKYYRLARLAELAGCKASQAASIKEQVTRSGPQVCSAISAPSATSGLRSQDSLKSDRFRFHTLDIEDKGALDKLFARSDFSAVFNLAARAGVRYSMEHPEVYLSTNVLGTLNILECMRRRGVKKLVLASTSSLYAGCPMPFTEDQPVNTPLSPYAATKKAAELMAFSYHRLYGLDVSVLRYFTVFGPGGRPDMSVFRFIKWIDEGKPLELFGDGSQSRDFTYVDDIARGTILAGQLLGGRLPGMKPDTSGVPQVSGLSPQVSHASSGLRSQVSGLSGGRQPAFEIINLGGGRNPISLQAVIAFIEKSFGRKAKIKGRPFHIADIKETWADISKAKRLLGWSPQVTAEEGFRRTVEWHVQNRKWLKGIKL